VLEALRTLPPGGVQASVVGGARLPLGSLLRVDLDVPAWASQVTLFFLDTAGEVVTLETFDRRAPGTRLRLGEPQGSFTGWTLAEPLGTDLVLAIASDGPVFAAPRPDAEPAEEFAAALRDALAEARAAGRRLAAGVVAVEVVAR
jgi:serine/threonine-protein kinase